MVQIQTTTPDKTTATRIAHLLIKQRLAACVQILPSITSIYSWDNKMEESEEWLCLIKTVEEQFAAVETVIRDNHPYEVPQIIGVPIVAAGKDYLGWVVEQCGGGEDF